MSDRCRLEVDAGNTRAKWRCIGIESGEVLRRGAFLLSGSRGVDSIHPRVKVDEIFISIVSDESKVSLIEAWISAGFEAEGIARNYIASSAMMCGVRFCYKDITRLGVDRCLAMVGAYHQSKGGVLVVDSGSALTADYIDCSGVHMGGYILPGVEMLRESLLGGTARVDVAKRMAVNVSPGGSTEGCVENGRMFMLQSFVAGLIKQGEGMGIENALFTGGDGELLASLVDRVECYREDLVFEGVALIADSGAGW